jgi:p-hydroxybenzoate 3-monooxygenase
MDSYPTNALKRIWKAQHYSYWMTTLLHTTPETTEFDKLRALGELSLLTSSRHAQQYLAEGYVGWDYGVDDWD